MGQLWAKYLIYMNSWRSFQLSTISGKAPKLFVSRCWDRIRNAKGLEGEHLWKVKWKEAGRAREAVETMQRW